ncbi:hypothetical protein E2562_030431 [Oryza meyeriana var. granulata]|uniref:Uncharacterized protein n=1 Tax=Oryza meyeriana var. granulata TaxID=110450 RepID=A0A6G1FDW8_9ORYZ|nr:hypothetical protein E2562_030431 [Oryza meyeriana var. granulata]
MATHAGPLHGYSKGDHHGGHLQDEIFPCFFSLLASSLAQEAEARATDPPGLHPTVAAMAHATLRLHYALAQPMPLLELPPSKARCR